MRSPRAGRSGTTSRASARVIAWRSTWRTRSPTRSTSTPSPSWAPSECSSTARRRRRWRSACASARHRWGSTPTGPASRPSAEGIGSLDGLRWVQLAEDLPAPPPAALPDAWRFRHAPEDPVSIMHSSGTTGIPKAVTQTHASSVAGPRYRLENYIGARQRADDDRPTAVASRVHRVHRLRHPRRLAARGALRPER